MSKYTTEVRFICETLAGFDTSQGYGKVKDIIEDSWDKVFDFDFPIFDEEYRSVICKKILMHYYTREIGLETVGLWKLKLETLMNEIMPYYNERYKSMLMKYELFKDADYYTEHQGSGKGESADDSVLSKYNDGTTSGRRTRGREETDYNIFSDTPQGALTNVNNETYLTDARKIMVNEDEGISYSEDRHDSGESTGNSTHNFSNTDEYVDHVYGKFPGKTYPALIREFRENIINVDVEVIDALKQLFMLVW